LNVYEITLTDGI